MAKGEFKNSIYPTYYHLCLKWMLTTLDKQTNKISLTIHRVAKEFFCPPFCEHLSHKKTPLFRLTYSGSCQPILRLVNLRTYRSQNSSSYQSLIGACQTLSAVSIKLLCSGRFHAICRIQAQTVLPGAIESPRTRHLSACFSTQSQSDRTD